MTSSNAPAWPLSALCVLDDPEPRAAAWNMACDEALLEVLSATPTLPPILRVYRWTHPLAISLGYFTPIAAARHQFPAAECVRRWTGGGVVAHGEGRDYTYSLLVPRALRLGTELRLEASYRLIHGALLQALQTGGLSGLALDGGIPRRSEENAAATPCFTRPVQADVLCAGQKVAGAAQRRSRLGLLHQGSVQGRALPADEAQRQTLTEAFSVAITADAVEPLWHCGTVETLPGLPPDFIPRVELLVETKYGSAAWLHKR